MRMRNKNRRILGRSGRGAGPQARISFLTLIQYFSFLTLCFAAFSNTASAQRDFLTAEEVEVVRDTQQIDERIGVLVHAIDRRFGVMQVAVGAVPKKPAGEWGELPQGTRAELLYDIKRILRKAVDDIDNLSERPDSMVLDPNDKSKKPKGFADLFPKAVRKLDAAARRYQPALKSLLETTKDAAEQGSIIDSLEMCDQIIAATAKLPPEVKKAKN